MNGFTKAQTGIISMLTVLLTSITRRLPERRFSSGMATRLILTGVVLLLVLAACSVPVSAKCCREPLETVINGTVNGGVYVDGDNSGNPPDFNVPAGTIKWARLYTDVFAHSDTGWINISFYNGTGYTYLNEYVSPDYGCNNTDQKGTYFGGGLGGEYWRYWNVTDIVRTGTNNATVTFAGDSMWVTGTLLVVVYDDGVSDPITYWINEGYVYLAKSGYPNCKPTNGVSTTWFDGDMSNAFNATLWTVYMMANQNPDQEDYLEINGHQITDDGGDGGGKTWTDDNFDVDKWVIDKNWVDASSNNLTYIRGNDTAVRAGLAVFLSEPPSPDLTISAFDTLLDLPDGQTRSAYVANHTYAINVTVKNVGNEAADAFDVTFEVEGGQKDTINVAAGLCAGSENVTTYYWTPTVAGDYTLNATADSGSDVDEGQYESNNATTESVTVLAEGDHANLDISQDDVTAHPTYANHAANNDTIVRIAVRNNGTGDAGDAGSLFKVQVVNTSTSAVLNETTTWLGAMCCRTVELVIDEVDLQRGLHNVTVRLDPDGTTTDNSPNNNTSSGDITIGLLRVLTTHTYGNASAYNGSYSNYTSVEMFDVVKLAPVGANPVELAASVAASSEEGGRGFYSLDGISEMGGHATQWAAFANGIPAPSWDYLIHDGDTIRWDFLTYINSGTGQQSFKPRPVMDYPEPFVHGYNGTVYDITIVYPDELCYPGKADAVEAGLIASGVPVERISKTAVESVTDLEKQNNDLILLGTESNNPLIADINSQRLDVGLPSYFDGSLMTDDSDDVSYVGGVIEACDNPYEGSADDSEANRSVWLAAAVEDYWAYKAADMLASDTGLDRFWVNREPYLVPTWDGTDVTLDWGNWTGNCASFNIYITNNLTAGFPANPNVSDLAATSWTDTNAGADLERYYKVTCGASGEQIEGDVSKVSYELEKSAINRRTWITMPRMNPLITSADELIKDIQPNCDKVCWWNSTSQQMETYSKLMPGRYGGVNFEVKSASGYEVTVTADTTWTVAGWMPPICPLELKKGAINRRTWIGMPFNTTIDDADELIKDIQPNCDKVCWWNSTSQQMETYSKLMPGRYGGVNFEVKSASGYEVTVTADTTWISR